MMWSYFNGGRSSVGRAPDCDSGRRGFEPHRPPQIFSALAYLTVKIEYKFIEIGFRCHSHFM